MNLEGWSWKWKSSSDNFLVIGNFSSFHVLKFFSEMIFREFCKHFKNFIQKIVRYYYNRNEKITIQFSYNKNVKFYPISLYFTFNRRNFPPPTPLPIRTSRILLRGRISLSIISKLWEWAVNFWGVKMWYKRSNDPSASREGCHREVCPFCARGD